MIRLCYISFLVETVDILQYLLSLHCHTVAKAYGTYKGKTD